MSAIPECGPTHRFAWGNNAKRATLKGRDCRVLARSRRMRSILIEFENGQREIVSARAVRRIGNNHTNNVVIAAPTLPDAATAALLATKEGA